jgi:hypothetical protein
MVHCREVGHVLWARGQDLVTRRVLLCTKSKFPALWATVGDVFFRYEPHCRIWLCTIAHSIGFVGAVA